MLRPKPEHKSPSKSKSGTSKKVGKLPARMARKPGASSGTSAIARAPKVTNPIPSGYLEGQGGILVPITDATPVTSSHFIKGLRSAKIAIKKTISEFGDFMTQDMEVAEIELSISINAKGEFLGFGVGGDATVKIKIKPIQQPA